MRTIIVTAVLLLLMASSGAAQTHRNRVGGEQVDTFFFQPSGGQVIITVMWLNGGADLAVALACGTGDGEPIIFGAAGGLMKKFVRMVSGVPATPGMVCGVAVTPIRGGTVYDLSILAQTEQTFNGAGRQAALAPRVGDEYAAVLEKQLSRIKRMAR